MAVTTAAQLVSPVVALLVITVGSAFAIASRGGAGPDAHDRPRGRRPGPMVRFRRTHPGGHQWEPLRITVRELRATGLGRWPGAPGVYVPHDDSLHCRRCVTDPATRAAVVGARHDHDHMLVLFGGLDEGELVVDNCASHGTPAA